jgi:hypothetical protein
MKLFTVEQVKKFFAILDRMGREVCKRYSDDNFAPCEKEVFVRRTVNKWFRGKYIVYYATSAQTSAEYKRYLYISNVRFVLGWGTALSVGIIDYARPVDVFESMTLSHNDVLDLEGEWVEDKDLDNYHHALLKMTTLNIPEREFVFKAYDMSKFSNKRNKKEYLETTVSVNAMTEKEAYRRKNELQKKNPEMWICPDIIEIKEIKV